MTDNTKQRVPISTLILYSVYLYAAWFIYHFFIIKYINNIPNELISGVVNDGICKNLIWTLPAFMLIGKYSGSVAFSPNKLIKFEKAHIKYLLLFPAFLLYILFGMLIHKTPIAISVTAKQLITVLFVGLTEEIVFRGWLLNATLPYAKPSSEGEELSPSQYIVIGINALMFLAIHFPRWLSEGIFVFNFASLGFISIIVLSAVFSLVFIKTKSLILPVTLHMFWDLIIFAVN